MMNNARVWRRGLGDCTQIQLPVLSSPIPVFIPSNGASGRAKQGRPAVLRSEAQTTVWIPGAPAPGPPPSQPELG